MSKTNSRSRFSSLAQCNLDDPNYGFTKSYQVNREKQLQWLNKDRDGIARRSSTKGKFKSNIIQLELWLQENLFAAANKPTNPQEKKDTELLIYGAAATMLAQIYPQFQPVTETYIQILTKFSEYASDKQIIQQNTEIGNSLIQLNIQLEELKDQIKTFDRQFQAKSEQLQQIMKEINLKKIELENLKQLDQQFYGAGDEEESEIDF